MSERFDEFDEAMKRNGQSAFRVVLLVVLAVLLGCSRESSDPTGGETHFLRLCDEESDSCGDLSCLCGVCTSVCEQDVACAEFPQSSCSALVEESCDGGESVRVCDRLCESDQECEALSPQHRCLDGACRLDLDQAPTCTSGEVLANEVVVIGDSFFATSHEITGFLEDLARNAGTLEVGERYRDLSRLTQNALALSGRGIQDQYQSATAEAATKVVLMNGGGADVLLGNCDEPTTECPLIVEAVAALEDLLFQMADDGVSDVVFLGYPDPEPPAVRERMDVLRPLLEQRCSDSPVPCHWVDLLPVFEGNYDEYIEPGGLNPTTAGSQASAEAIWATFESNCIAQ